MLHRQQNSLLCPSPRCYAFPTPSRMLANMHFHGAIVANFNGSNSFENGNTHRHGSDIREVASLAMVRFESRSGTIYINEE